MKKFAFRIAVHQDVGDGYEAFENEPICSTEIFFKAARVHEHLIGQLCDIVNGKNEADGSAKYEYFIYHYSLGKKYAPLCTLGEIGVTLSGAGVKMSGDPASVFPLLLKAVRKFERGEKAVRTAWRKEFTHKNLWRAAKATIPEPGRNGDCLGTCG